MRTRDLPAGPASSRGRSPRRTVLLLTESGPSAVSLDLAAGCRTLLRGLTEVEFVVWTLSVEPQAPSRVRTNVVRRIEQPAWNAPDGLAFGSREHYRRRPAPSEVERGFVAALRSFLWATIDPNGPGDPLAATLLDLRDHLRRWDPARTWRSPHVWEVVRDHLLVRTPSAGGEDVVAGTEPAASLTSDELPTIGEAAQALAWLARMLAPLTVEIPKTDLVHATTAGFSAIPGMVARIERGTPLLLSEHGIAPRDLYLDLQRLGAPFHLKRFAADVSGAVARTVYRVADRIAPASRHTMRWELAYGAPRTRMEVVHPGVDDAEFRPNDVPRTGRPTVVQVSRIEPERDQLTLLQVADLVRREVPDVVFLQFGEVVDRSYWEEVRRTRRELDLEDVVRFVGPAADLPGALGLGDLALVTSRSEAFPRLVLEAAMCGLPVVATDVGGIREALDGAGIIAPAGDAAALAEAVAATLRVSPEQAEALRRAARDQAVARFGLQRFLDDSRRLYEELDPGPGAAPSEPAAEPAATGGVVVAPPEDVVEIPEAAVEEVAATAAGSEQPPPALEGVGIVVEGEELADRLEIVEQPAAEEAEPAAESTLTVDSWLAAAWDRPGDPEGSGEAALGAAAAAAGMHAMRGESRDEEAEPAREATVTAESGTAAATGTPAPERLEPEPAELEPAMAGAGPAAEPPPRPSDVRSRLTDPDPGVRIEALRDLHGPGSADYALAAMSDDHPEVRREAARALGRFNGPRAGRWLSNAVSGDPSAEVRGEAVAALAALLTRRPEENR